MPAPVAQIGDCDALQAEQDRQFPTVMQVMGHDVPDGSLARNQVHLPVVKMAIGLRQIGERPGGERGFNDLPE
jgi:hypothetical protein